MGLRGRATSLAYFLLTMFLVSYGLVLVVKGYFINFVAARVRKSRTPPSGIG